MLELFRQLIIKNLWQFYRNNSLDILHIEQALTVANIKPLHLDHLAIIDLPSPNSGLKELTLIFSCLGYLTQGCDYLASKQNPFLWLSEIDSINKLADQVLPQIVVADFKLDIMPTEIAHIIYNYAQHIPPSPLGVLQKNIGKIYHGDKDLMQHLGAVLTTYLTQRDWPLPSYNDYRMVKEYNELLAWVLVMGRCPNHFTYAIHLSPAFKNLHQFNEFVTSSGLMLNQEGGTIKGNQLTGIEQSSTQGQKQILKLNGGQAEISRGFFEFVWRYPRVTNPQLWSDYYPNFIAQQADHVIESLYDKH